MGARHPAVAYLCFIGRNQRAITCKVNTTPGAEHIAQQLCVVYDSLQIDLSLDLFVNRSQSE